MYLPTYLPIYLYIYYGPWSCVLKYYYYILSIILLLTKGCLQWILNSIVLWADPPSKVRLLSHLRANLKTKNKQTNNNKNLQNTRLNCKLEAKSQESSCFSKETFTYLSFCLLILVCTQVWMPYKWSTSDKLLCINIYSS